MASVIDDLRDDGILAAHVPGTGLTALPFVMATWLCVIATAGAALADAAAVVTGFSLLGVLVGLLAVAGKPSPRFAWLTPPALRALEYVCSIAVSWTAVGRPAMPALVAYLAAVIFHHYEAVYRLQQLGHAPRDGVGWLLGGWEGRVLLLLTLLPTVGPLSLWVLAGWCAGVALTETSWEWSRATRSKEG